MQGIKKTVILVSMKVRFLNCRFIIQILNVFQYIYFKCRKLYHCTFCYMKQLHVMYEVQRETGQAVKKVAKDWTQGLYTSSKHNVSKNWRISYLATWKWKGGFWGHGEWNGDEYLHEKPNDPFEVKLHLQQQKFQMFDAIINTNAWWLS